MPEYSDGYAEFISLLKEDNPSLDLDKIERAYQTAKQLHEGQFRLSGDPYITHPVAVAALTADITADTDAVCAALLHDVVEDVEGLPADYVERHFGTDVAMLVNGVTKLQHIAPFESKEEEQIENLRRMILAVAQDVRVIFIKLADRLHNMRTIFFQPDEKRRRISLETMEIYAPLAHRLGMQKIKLELEDIALSCLDPMASREIEDRIREGRERNADFLSQIEANVSEKLRQMHIESIISSRTKSIYSVYRKMYGQNKEFDEIYDIYGLRVIVDTEPECYAVLGVVHDMFTSVPGRFKDYISTPKSNMYRSLHTTVIGRGGIPFEVQIRTKEMHHVAEYGIAAHWKYKQGIGREDSLDKKLEWLRTLVEIERDSADTEDFMRPFKIDLFADEVFVFSPKGDVIPLPAGATVIDFAYAIHSAVGNRMVGAKVNGKIVTIDYRVQTGQIVEILTSASARGPSRDWLKIARTGEAKSKIKQWFKKEKRPENIEQGRADFHRELGQYASRMTEAERNDLLETVAQKAGFPNGEDLLAALGYGGAQLSKVSHYIGEECERRFKPKLNEAQRDALALEDARRQNHNYRSSNGIVVEGIDNCLVKFARCCTPLPGEEIIGYITKGSGVSVHRKDCRNVVSGMKDPSSTGRWIGVHWDRRELNGDGFAATISIAVESRQGLIADLTSLIANMRVKLLHLNTTEEHGEISSLSVTLGVSNLGHLNSIIEKLRRIRGVNTVTRN